MPVKKSRKKKINTQNVKKDLDMILEMNSNVIIHRLLNNEGDIDLFIQQEFKSINSKIQKKKKI